MHFFDSSGGPLFFDAKLGEGGEGAVYSLRGVPDLVAKIYTKPERDASREKLTAMVAMANEASGSDDSKVPLLLRLTTWPVGLVFDGKKRVLGFLMPRLPPRTRNLHELSSPFSAAKHYPLADWRMLTHVAANAARAFAVVHKHGCVIGDVNEGGLQVTPDATLRLVDCDSFQIRVADTLYHCRVSTPDYTPPEIQPRVAGAGLKERTANHDNFGLAIIIFKLLFRGRHPYFGIYSGSDETSSISHRIVANRFAFGSQHRQYLMEPPAYLPPISIVGAEAQGLFERAFAPDAGGPVGRPTALEWLQAMQALTEGLIPCALNPSHHYGRFEMQCPWCSAEQRVPGYVAFQPLQLARLHNLLNEADRIKPLAPLGQLTTNPAVAPPPRFAEDNAYRLWVGACIAWSGLYLLLGALGYWHGIDWALGLSAAFVALQLYNLQDIRSPIVEDLAVAEKKYDGLMKVWNIANGEEFDAKLIECKRLRASFNQASRSLTHAQVVQLGVALRSALDELSHERARVEAARAERESVEEAVHSVAQLRASLEAMPFRPRESGYSVISLVALFTFVLANWNVMF